MSPVKNNPLPDVIGSTLKAAREARKLERAELANSCCLSAKMILELKVVRQPSSTLNFSLGPEQYRSYLLKMIHTRDLYVKR